MQNLPPTPQGLTGLTRLEAIVSIVIICALFAFILPTFTKTMHCGNLTKYLSNAKQIYLGLAMYAEDHNGAYLSRNANSSPFANSNEAFRLLIPDYIPTEQIFYVRDSPWTPARPDDKTGDGKTLTAGENHWAYVPNQNQEITPHHPMIAEGFAKGTPGTYDAWIKKRSEKSSRFPVIVVRTDGAGKVEAGSKSDLRVYGDDGTGKAIDLFKPAPNWLRPEQAPLNPEG